MSLLFGVISLFLISAQGLDLQKISGLDSEQDGLMSDIKGMLEDIVKDVRQEGLQKVEYLKDSVDSAAIKGAKDIDDRYELSRNLLSNIQAPQVCLEEAMTHLQKMKSASMNEFLKCSNLTTAAEDVVSIMFEAGDLATTLLMAGDLMINGFGDCISWNPVKFAICSFKWTKNLVVSLHQVWKEAKGFTAKVKALESDMIAQIQYCRQGGSDSVLLHTTSAMERLHQCAGPRSILKDTTN